MKGLIMKLGYKPIANIIIYKRKMKQWQNEVKVFERAEKHGGVGLGKGGCTSCITKRSARHLKEVIAMRIAR